MAKVKLTKTELKAQSDALKRFQRFLPMLQLKKQQLQAEIASIAARIESVAASERSARAGLESWIALFSDAGCRLDSIAHCRRVVTAVSNIAGVTIPVFERVEADLPELDLFATPAWMDDARAAALKVMGLQAEQAVLRRQSALIEDELSMTSQRVNLFEKVKIPECKEAIRKIKIAIGDEQTASVTRGKIAKSRGRKETPESAKAEDAA